MTPIGAALGHFLNPGAEELKWLLGLVIGRFLHISTDEVYGSIIDGSFKEGDPLEPNSPYSASKAGGDLLVRSYFVTYGTPVVITRSSNNYGPYQYPEKLIPLFVTNAIENKNLRTINNQNGTGYNYIALLSSCKETGIRLIRSILFSIFSEHG